MNQAITTLYERLGRRDGISRISNGIDISTRNEVLAILWSLKDEVIRA